MDTPTAPIFVCIVHHNGALKPTIVTDFSALRTLWQETSRFNFQLLEKHLVQPGENLGAVSAELFQKYLNLHKDRKQGKQILVTGYRIEYDTQHQTYTLTTEHAEPVPCTFYTPPVYPHAFLETLLQSTVDQVTVVPDNLKAVIRNGSGTIVGHASVVTAESISSSGLITSPPLNQSPKLPRKQRRVPQIKVHDGKPSNYMTRWTEDEYVRLALAVQDKEVTVELIQSIADDHKRTFSAIQGKLFSKEHITRFQSIAISDQLKAQSPTLANDDVVEMISPPIAEPVAAI